MDRFKPATRQHLLQGHRRWKVIVYLGKGTSTVASNAFIVFQDDEAITALRQVLGHDDLDPFALYHARRFAIDTQDAAHDLCPDLGAQVPQALHFDARMK